jgi:hypothetical protein
MSENEVLKRGCADLICEDETCSDDTTSTDTEEPSGSGIFDDDQKQLVIPLDQAALPAATTTRHEYR